MTVSNSRTSKAKLNIVVSLACQVITMITGIVIPRVMLSCFGSEVYGATTSISQFLSYIALLEGGVGAVARSVLYKPLADDNKQQISAIVKELKSFFRNVGLVFLVYVVILSVSFKSLSHIQALDWLSTFILVIVISLSTFAQYFIGISYVALLQADQKLYITYLINMITIILNAVLVVIFANLGMNIILVKLFSSCIFAARPVLLSIYVKRNYVISRVVSNEKYLHDKWTGLGQHIAFYVHTNTDISILTFFANLKEVAVYSVYYMIVNSIQSIVTSFSNGMEAVFGDMYAKEEVIQLRKTFSLYDTMISMVSTIFYSVTTVVIIPFITLYTRNIVDVTYTRPFFGLILITSSYIFCIRTPYHAMIIAAGRFRETKWAAYGEAAVNLLVSIILVIRFGLIGVAIGTVTAVVFRYAFYVIYLTKNILNIPICQCAKRFIINIFCFITAICVKKMLVDSIVIQNYFQWVIVSFISFVGIMIFVLLVNYFFYKEDLIMIFKKIRKKVAEV